MITKEMTIADIFDKYPQQSQRLAQAMSKAGLQCAGCHASTSETLEEGVAAHGYPPEALETLLKTLNGILEEKIDPNTITMTQAAAEKFQEFAKEEGQEGVALRFGDSAGGCSGFEYILDYSNQALPNDAIFESHGVQIHIDKESLPRLLGCVIDYADGLHGSGFKISNPNVKKSCRCGNSQAY